MNQSHRIMVIGLDGATLDLIEPWVEQGYLPNLARLMQQGSYSRLQSIMPVVSAGAWTSFMTGTNPGKHGMFDFVRRENTSYKLIPTTRNDIRMPSLWKLLSEAGKKVCVMNVPMTYPPEKVNGCLISGLGTPNFKSFAYPPELEEELLKDGYRVNRRIYYPGNDLEAFLADTDELIKLVTRNAVRQLKESTWDFFMVVYRETDDVPHGFWRFMDPSHPRYVPNSPYRDTIRDMYQQLDQSIGELIAFADENTTVLIMSDHGFGPLYKDVYLNEWLRQKGYLFTRETSKKNQWLSRMGITRDQISRTLRTMGLMSVEKLIKQILGEKIAILPKTQWPDFDESINWSKTKAYSYGFQGQIYINLAGREPNGIVQAGSEYETLREQICQELSDLRDPDDGQPVVSKLYKREDLYQGDALTSAPDIILVLRDLSFITRLGHEFGNTPGEVFGISRVNESGSHRFDGTLIAQGPAISPSDEMPSTWIGDLAPTILHLLGCPVPHWMDGVVLEGWLTPAYKNLPVQISHADIALYLPPNQEMSHADQTEIMQRLKDLGYL